MKIWCQPQVYIQISAQALEAKWTQADLRGRKKIPRQQLQQVQQMHREDLLPERASSCEKGAGQSRCRKTWQRWDVDMMVREKKAWGGGAGWQVVKWRGRMRWKVEEHVHDKNEGVKDGWERKREVNHAAVINPQPCVISLHKYLKRRGWRGYTRWRI